MNGHQQTPDEPREIEATGDRPRSAWFNALAGIVVSPRASFEIIRRNTPWLPTLLLLGTLALGELSRPYQERGVRAQLAEVLPGGAEQADMLMATADQAGPIALWTGRAAAGVTLAVGLLIQTLLLWLLAMALQGQARFPQVLSLMVHLKLIPLIQGFATFLIASLRGLDAVQSMEDAQPVPGLNLLLAGDNAALNVVWASLNPFTLWFLILLGLGATSVLGLPQRRGYLLAGVYWAATTAFTATLAGVGAAVMPG